MKQKGSWDETWERVFQSQEWGKYPEVELVRFIARNFYKAPDRKKIKILDLGCGTGANSWYIAREGFDVYAIDGSKTAINILKKRFENEGLKCSAYIGDVIQLPFEDGFFDAVIELECLAHNTIPNIKKIINEIYRVLKKDGKFYSQFFGKNTWGFGKGERVEEGTYKNISEGFLAGKGIVHFTDEKELSLLFSKFNSINIEIITRTLNNPKNLIQEYIIIAVK